ncbi:hypothetical protein QFZ80_005663 [Paenibacillus sp. V4I7]|nr:hypothetical protein [Paenibacillus sp. V4I7]
MYAVQLNGLQAEKSNHTGILIFPASPSRLEPKEYPTREKNHKEGKSLLRSICVSLASICGLYAVYMRFSCFIDYLRSNNALLAVLFKNALSLVSSFNHTPLIYRQRKPESAAIPFITYMAINANRSSMQMNNRFGNRKSEARSAACSSS